MIFFFGSGFMCFSPIALCAVFHHDVRLNSTVFQEITFNAKSVLKNAYRIKYRTI